jgi:hypothetical protein
VNSGRKQASRLVAHFLRQRRPKPNLDALTGAKNFCMSIPDEGFDLVYGAEVPRIGDSNTKQSASKYVADNGFIEAVDVTGYLPMHKDQILSIDGVRTFNSFRPSSVPNEALNHPAEGWKAIERLQRHVLMICDNERDAEIFMLWLCHQVQFPGIQIGWAIIVQSIQGAGKSYFAKLLRKVLGNDNVGIVGSTQVTSRFTGWSINRCVNVLEELRVMGHNRHEALNAVKPLITDEFIQVEEKGINAYQTRNTANYLALTNFKDALPLDENDRRWFVISVALSSLDEIEEITGENKTEYFNNLFVGIDIHSAEIRKWMLEYVIPDSFKAIKQAPMTVAKRMMVATEESAVEGLAEAREAIAEGGQLWNKDCVSSTDLLRHLNDDFEEMYLNSNDMRNILKKLGFQKCQQRPTIGGSSKRIWVSRPMTMDEIRTSLG